MKRIGLAGLVALGGCSVALSPTPLGSGVPGAAGADRDAAIAGVVYSLPFAQFETALTWKLKKCAGMDVEVELGATTKVNNLPDPTKTFALDYRDLASAMKTSSFELELHPNRMVKSFGTSAVDQTGEVVVAAVKTVASIAATAAGFRGRLLGGRSITPPSSAAAMDPQRATRGEACTDRTRLALQDETRLKAQVAELTADLALATDRLAAMSSLYTSMGRYDARIRDSFFTDAKTVRSLQEELGTAKERLADVVKLLTIPHLVRWPREPAEIRSDIALPASRLAKATWFSGAFTPGAGSFVARMALSSQDPLALQHARDNTEAKGDNIAEPRLLPISPLPSPGGLYYRQPVEGTLTACYSKKIVPTPQIDAAKPASACVPGAREEDPLITTGIPQLARLQFLPYANGPFQDNELKASFSENGSLVKVSYDAKSSAAAAIKGAQDVVSAVKAGIKDVREAGPAAQLADLKAQTDIAKQRKELASALAALGPPKTDAEKEQTAVFETNTALKNAELANIKATQALVDARAKATEP